MNLPKDPEKPIDEVPYFDCIYAIAAKAEVIPLQFKDAGESGQNGKEIEVNPDPVFTRRLVLCISGRIFLPRNPIELKI
jgi:hypothetical protein